MPKFTIKPERSWVQQMWEYQLRLNYIMGHVREIRSAYHEDRHLDTIAYSLCCCGFDRGRWHTNDMKISMPNLLQGFYNICNFSTPHSLRTTMLEEVAWDLRLAMMWEIRAVYLSPQSLKGQASYRSSAMQRKIEALLAIQQPPAQKNITEQFLIRCREMQGSGHVRRQLFLTKKGLVGLGPERSQAGDAVALIHGAYTPFVLRWKTETETSEPICKMIGESYVHGSMDREPLDFPGEYRPRGMRPSQEALPTIEPVPTGEEMWINIV